MQEWSAYKVLVDKADGSVWRRCAAVSLLLDLCVTEQFDIRVTETISKIKKVYCPAAAERSRSNVSTL